MRTCAKSSAFLIISMVWLGFALSLQAASPLPGTPIYDNSVNDLQTPWSPGTLEVGNRIILAPGTGRYLTYFDFEYWGNNTLSSTSFAGDVEARVRFYLNNGTPPFNGYDTPSDCFYDSGWFGGFGPTGPMPSGPGFRATIYFTSSDWLAYDPSGGGTLLIPGDEITWTVQFEGMGLTDTVGLDLCTEPVVGQVYPDYWENTGSGWILLTNNVPMDFGARMAVPEPSSLVLSLIGGMSLLVLARRLRWNN